MFSSVYKLAKQDIFLWFSQFFFFIKKKEFLRNKLKTAPHLQRSLINIIKYVSVFCSLSIIYNRVTVVMLARKGPGQFFSHGLDPISFSPGLQPSGKQSISCRAGCSGNTRGATGAVAPRANTRSISSYFPSTPFLISLSPQEKETCLFVQEFFDFLSLSLFLNFTL